MEYSSGGRRGGKGAIDARYDRRRRRTDEAPTPIQGFSLGLLALALYLRVEQLEARGSHSPRGKPRTNACLSVDPRDYRGGLACRPRNASIHHFRTTLESFLRLGSSFTRSFRDSGTTSMSTTSANGDSGKENYLYPSPRCFHRGSTYLLHRIIFAAFLPLALSILGNDGILPDLES